MAASAAALVLQMAEALVIAEAPRGGDGGDEAGGAAESAREAAAALRDWIGATLDRNPILLRELDALRACVICQTVYVRYSAVV